MLRRGGLFLMGLALAVLSPRSVSAGDETLCAIAPGTYAAAKASSPEMAFAIAELEKHAVATWYTDRTANGDSTATAQQLVATCPESSRMTVVVYGMPNKDCEARESMVGSRNTNSAMYQDWVSTLQQTVGNRKVLYIIEPDAIALLANGGCAKQYGYGDNLAIAVLTLSQNPNADLYLDVGHWMLQSVSDLSNVVSIVRGLAAQGRIKGITINTSNYRSTSELSSLCGKFISATGGLNLHCIIDTSRNFNGASSQDEWCNFKNAGVGEIPTGNTGDPNIDYYVWIKPPGESDGTCSGRTSDAMTGPGAGAFFPDFMKQLWNNGALVKSHGMAVIDGTIRAVAATTPAPTTAAPTPEPTPAPTPEPTPSPTADNSTEQASNSTASEDRSLDLPDFASATGSSSSAATGVTESAEVSAGVVSSPEEQQPAFANTPSGSSDAPAQSAGGVQQANTKSAAGGNVSAGIVVLVCLVAVALVALVAVVAIRLRQRSIEETKTPMDPRVDYLSSVPGSISNL